MNRRARLLGVAVVGVLVLVVTGLLLVAGGSGPTTPPSTTPTEAANDEPYQVAEIDISIRSFEQRNATLAIDVFVEHRGYEAIDYEQPMLCLYSDTGEILYSETLSPITNPDSTYFEQNTVRADMAEMPTYIVVDHPTLRNDSRFATEILIWKPQLESFDVGHRPLGEIQNDFPFPRTDETGVCG